MHNPTHEHQQRNAAIQRHISHDHGYQDSTAREATRHRQKGPEEGTGRPIRAFQLDESGLRRVLGSLESDVLEAIWHLTPGAASTAEGWTTIGRVCQHLGAGYHYKTVQTVMNRMVDKQLLLRRHEARAHEYRAALTREELILQVTRSVMDGLVQDFGEVAIAQLEETLESLRPDRLALLRQLSQTTEERPDTQEAQPHQPGQRGDGT